MSTPPILIATKLYIPPHRPGIVLRPRLSERLQEGLQRRLTLLSAPAGFGKTTLVSAWAAGCGVPVAWLSLDAADSDPARFLAYFVAALQTIMPMIGPGIGATPHYSQPPPVEALLAALLNQIAASPGHFMLVLDDYHVIDAPLIGSALAFVLQHLPPQMHLLLATREDPPLPLTRLRAQGELLELRASDLRFTFSEAAEFLSQRMGLALASEHIAALEARTEGWIAGLQLAAISMQGHQDAARFIQTFSGTHHFVLDYLVEEVLQRQPERVQTFLLHTSILERLCGPLCEAVLHDRSRAGQATLEYLERANLFVVPLDNERRWYRYHHLFADLLRQRLQHTLAPAAAVTDLPVAELHRRASQWYEDHDLDLEAFQHAAAAQDIERAERLIDGKGIPLHMRGAVTAILEWLESLPTAALNARPTLWLRYASLLLVNGQTSGVEAKLRAAEAAFQTSVTPEALQPFLGHIATARAVLALTRYDSAGMLAHARQALEQLAPQHLALRATANWTRGFAYLGQRNRAAARQALNEAIALSQAAGDVFTTILATIGLGQVQEEETQLYQAAETYRRVLHLAGDQPLQIINEAHLGLARVLYAWNDLATAEHHARRSLQLARQYDTVVDRFLLGEVFFARLKLAQGALEDAAALLDQAGLLARQHQFVQRIPDIAAAQIQVLLRQGNSAAAVQLALTHRLPLSQARAYLASGEVSAALAVLEPLRQEAEANAWHDERLIVLVLQALAHHALGATDTAVHVLGEALALAEPGAIFDYFSTKVHLWVSS